MTTPPRSSHPHRALALVVAVVALATRAPQADAGGRPRVAVLEIRIEGDAAPELRDQLDKSLAAGLNKAGWDVVSRNTVARRLEGSSELVGCMTTTCLEAIGRRVGARRFVRVRVSATGAAYNVEIELLAADVATGPIARLEKSCAPCTFDEANEMMANAATQLHEGAGDKVTVHVSSEPAGAAIELDGKALGVAPLELEMPPGDHVFRAHQAGRGDALVTASVTQQPNGDAQVVALTLPALGVAPVVENGAHLPPPGPVNRGTPSRGPYRVWKWVAVGGAAAALAAGVWLMAVDGDGVDCPSPAGQCPYTRNTMLGGGALSVAGVGLGGLATWMFLADRPESSGTSVAARPLAGGGMLYFSKTF